MRTEERGTHLMLFRGASLLPRDAKAKLGVLPSLPFGDGRDCRMGVKSGRRLVDHPSVL